MKSKWTPGPVQWRHLGKSHEAALWMLWIVALFLLCVWLVGIAVGAPMGGWIHGLAVLAVILGVICTYQIFRYGEFLERPVFRRFHGRRFRRFRGER